MDKGRPLVLGNPLNPSLGSATLTTVGLSVLHVVPTGPVTGDWSIWPIQSFNAAPPTDLLYGCLEHREGVLRANVVMSYAVPRIGSNVRCIGYTGFRPEGGLSKSVLEVQGPVGSGYGHQLGVVEGSVTAIFTKEFTKGFGGGPCFAIDAEVPHGYSGGPALNKDGNVCGVVSSGATNFFDTPTSIIALPYPAIHSPIDFRGTKGPLTVHGRRSPAELIQLGLMTTDGTENHPELVDVSSEGILIGTKIHRDDRPFVFEDFRGYQEGRPASTSESDG